MGMGNDSVKRQLEEYQDTLVTLSDELYYGRIEFLRKEFEGYVDGTVYYPKADEYILWPARTEGYFEGFTDITPQEQRVVEKFEERGFELLGNGVFRVTFAMPIDGYVVKVGRGSLNARHHDGRMQNLAEAAITVDPPSELIPQCKFCALDGSYMVFPRAKATLDEFGFEHDLLNSFRGDETGKTVNGVTVTGSDVVEFREQLADAFQSMTVGRRMEFKTMGVQNVGVYTDGIRLIDVNMVEDDARFRGYPEVVDLDDVITEVDELRMSGEKFDVAEGGGLIDPSQ